MHRGDLAQRKALEIGPARLPRDLECFPRVPLDAREVAAPPADARQERQRLGARVARCVREQRERLQRERPGAVDIGVAIEVDIRQLRESEALDRPLSRRLGQGAHVLHLEGRRGELPQPPGRPGGIEPALEARLEVDRAQKEPACGAVRLAVERPAPGALECVGRLRAQLCRNLSVELGRERRRALQVVCLGLHELLGRPRAQPVDEHAVEPCPLALGETRVRDIANQHVAEAERGFARDRRDRLAREELAIDEVDERGVDVECRIEIGDGAAPEHATDEGAVADDRPRVWRQPVDARRDQRLHGVGDPHRHPLAPLREHPDRLFDEERIALRLLEQGAPDVVGQHGVRGKGVDEHLGLALGQRPEIDRDRPSPPTSPARARLEQLGTRKTHDQHRRVVDPVREVLDEVEQRILGPVDVLEAEHERLRLGEAHRPLLGGPRDLLPASPARDGVEHTGRETEEIGDRVARARLAELLECLLGGVVGRDPGCRLHHLRQRPVRQTFAEGQRPPGEDARPLEAGEELAGEPALPDPGLPEDRDELRAAVADGARKCVLEQLELLLAADVRPDDVQRTAGRPLGADDSPHLEAAGEAPERPVTERLRHDSRGEPPGGRAHEDLAGLRGLLEPGRDIESLAGREGGVALVDDDLPGLDPDPHGQLAVARLDDRDRRPHRALGIVLVRGRHPEDGEHRVAGELLDGPAVGLDVRPDPVEEARHTPPRDLRVIRGDERSRVHEVDEQRRRELALHASKSRFGGLPGAGGLPNRGGVRL